MKFVRLYVVKKQYQHFSLIFPFWCWLYAHTPYLFGINVYKYILKKFVFRHVFEHRVLYRFCNNMCCVQMVSPNTTTENALVIVSWGESPSLLCVSYIEWKICSSIARATIFTMYTYMLVFRHRLTHTHMHILCGVEIDATGSVKFTHH